MKKILSAAIFSVLLLSMPGALNQAEAVLVPADICFLVDTSGSMGGDIAQVKANIVAFNTAMTNAGIDAHYCLVEFGGNSGNGATSGTAVLFQDVTDFATFNAAGNPFSLLSASGGGDERGVLAAQVALNTATFRPGSVINLILLTDEDDDTDGVNQPCPCPTTGVVNGLLMANNALFNFIGIPGIVNSIQTYEVLAAANGGTAFNILAFRADPVPFFNNFINVKVQEILGMQVGGEYSPIDTTALLIAGAQSSVVSIVSVLSLVGAVGIGAFYYTKRKN